MSAAQATKSAPAPTVEPPDRQVVYLDPKLIRWLPVKKDERTRDPKFAETLSQSIDTDGLLNFPIVRTDPDKAGHYVGVDGWHRTTAMTKFLKWSAIPAIIDDGGSEDDYRSKTIAANLFRNPLQKNQAAKAIADWHKIYEARVEAYKVAKLKAKEAKKQQSQAPKEQPGTATVPADPSAQVQVGPEAKIDDPNIPDAPVEPAVEAVEVPPKPPENFAKEVAAATGQSPTSVKRSLKIGKTFSAEQLATLDAEKVSQDLCETIANLPQHQRDPVVSLIASGLDPVEAIAEVTKRAEVKTVSGQVKTVATKAVDKAEKEMSDAAWIETYCSEALERLPEPAQARFRVQAILYRETRQARALFASKFAGPLDRVKRSSAGELNAGLAGTLERIGTVEHPKHWRLCGSCTGSRLSENTQARCVECFGLGFKVTYGKRKL